jgi:beta-barrel assembly-enhancing protease
MSKLMLVVAVAATFILHGCVTPKSQFAASDPVAVELEAKKQKELYVQTRLRDEARLDAITARLITANADICGERTAGYLGLSWWNAEDIGKDYREAATALHRLSNVLQVRDVIPGGPAHQAGIAVGDHIVKVAGRDAPIGEGATDKLRDRLRERMTDKKTAQQPVEIVLRRNGAARQAIVAPVSACDFPIRIQTSEGVNAFADGKQMIVTQGMLRFVETDDELAFIVGHELAHNAMGHIDAQKTNATMAGAGGLLLEILVVAATGVNTQGSITRAAANAGAGAFSVDFEREADYVGLYMVARAGFGTDDAPNVWRRMAMRNPGSIEHSKSHPTSADRFVSLEKANTEIKVKRTSGVALLPEMKPKSEPNPDSQLQAGGTK